ncbi:dynein light chain 1, cytoplasmic-like [Teleopsis dalmanni]|uniref:dynein light chain 1, cytoplasmic-like n=1 Tax=Teleopsis dalmanni TaxID=139649 RepID=UPI0018CD4D1F|nr:dynein light chain 1, cytoplasmic-like [Teleopsis dalmanni]
MATPEKPPEPEAQNQGDRVIKVIKSDMAQELQLYAFEAVNFAKDVYTDNKDIAAHIKRQFDAKYNPTWHCIVGRSFASYVTHESPFFIYFYIGYSAVLLYKCG